MKKTLTLVAVLGLANFTAVSQDTETESPEVVYEQNTNFFKTPPLRELLKTIPPVDDETFYINDKPKPIKESRYMDLSTVDHIEDPDAVDDVLQSENGTNNSGGFRTFANFNGQFGAFPPDPSGAAGPNYYVQAVNSTYRIYEKDGTPETPPYSLNMLWDRPGSGDPIVMYDRFAERWFISQFYGSPGGPAVGMLIAVSETSDPLGAYYAYEFAYPAFPDYPKFSVWSNAYYMTANTAVSDFSAFDREKMLVGDPTAGVIRMNFPPLTLAFNSLAPAYAEGPIEPDMDEPCYFFAVQDNAFPGVTTDHIKVLKAEVNFDVPSMSSISIEQEINTAPVNALFPGGFSENISQRGTSQRLDAIPGIFMYRAQYRRFDGYNVIMLCHSANIVGGRAGMRWYELRDKNDGVWEIHQQGTYAPDTQNSRWLGNLAMDIQGNIALAYSFTGPDHFPGIRYTGRFHDDPLGEMTVPEQIAVEGVSAQTAAGRYGDYSQMSMDPEDDFTFWFTGEYIGTSQSRRTRIFSFSSWTLSGLDEESKKPAQFNAYQPHPGEIMLTWKDLPNDENLIAQVTDLSGRFIAKEQLDWTKGQHLVNIPSSVHGIFLVSITGKETNLVQKIYIAR